MKKKWKWIIIAIVVMLCFCSCTGKRTKPAKTESTLPAATQTEPTETTQAGEETRDAAFYSGTWTVTGVNVNGVDISADQAIALGAEQLKDVRMILTSDGVIYLEMNGDSVSDHWTVTDNGIQAGTAAVPFEDGRLAFTSNKDLLYFEKQSDDQTLPETAAPTTEAPTEPETTEQETTEPTEAQTEAPSGIRPEFKDAMDSYEAFYDEYCDLMAKYTKNPADFTLLTKYMDMLSKVDEMDKKFAAWDQSDMSKEELKYYLEVTARVQKKIVDMF